MTRPHWPSSYYIKTVVRECYGSRIEPGRMRSIKHNYIRTGAEPRAMLNIVGTIRNMADMIRITTIGACREGVTCTGWNNHNLIKYNSIFTDIIPLPDPE